MVKINYRHCINNHCNKFINYVHYEQCMRVYSWYTHNGDKLVLGTLPVNTHHTHKGGSRKNPPSRSEHTNQGNQKVYI